MGQRANAARLQLRKGVEAEPHNSAAAATCKDSLGESAATKGVAGRIGRPYTRNSASRCGFVDGSTHFISFALRPGRPDTAFSQCGLLPRRPDSAAGRGPLSGCAMRQPDGSWDPFDDYVLDFAVAGMRAGERAAIVTLVEIEGSSPRPLGAQMAVTESGAWVGYLSGGCIERAIAEEAVDALAQGRSRRVRYGRGSRYIDISLPCGSAIELVFDVEVPLSRLEAIDARLRGRQAARMDVPMSGPQIEGAAGPARILRRTYLPRRRIVVFGLGPVAVKLASVAAAAGFEVALHTPDDATAAAAGTTASSGAAIEEALRTVDSRSAIVFAFHDHDREERLLPAALATDAFYIGAMGSRITHARRLELMRARGLDERTLGRIHGPAGLLDHAKSAVDLAVSIVAQVVATARNGEAEAVAEVVAPPQPMRTPGGEIADPVEARL